MGPRMLLIIPLSDSKPSYNQFMTMQDHKSVYDRQRLLHTATRR